MLVALDCIYYFLLSGNLVGSSGYSIISVVALFNTLLILGVLWLGFNKSGMAFSGGGSNFSADSPDPDDWWTRWRWWLLGTAAVVAAVLLWGFPPPPGEFEEFNPGGPSAGTTVKTVQVTTPVAGGLVTTGVFHLLSSLGEEHGLLLSVAESLPAEALAHLQGLTPAEIRYYLQGAPLSSSQWDYLLQRFKTWEPPSGVFDHLKYEFLDKARSRPTSEWGSLREDLIYHAVKGKLVNIARAVTF